jgi:hypothetical protein
LSPFTITLIRFGFLALLWIFVFAIVGVLRSDIYGTRVSRRSQRRAANAGATAGTAGAGAGAAAAAGAGAAAPAAATTGSVPPPRYPTPPRGQQPADQAAPPRPAQHAGSRPPVLTVTTGPLAGTTIPLRAGGVVIGRNPECALVLPDDFASGRHVKIYATTQGWYAEDLGSTNGTLLDDAALRPGSPQPMRTGAVLTVGRTTLELRG